MGTPYVGNAATFLIGIAFGFLILAALLRLLFAWVRADFYNPVSQFVVQVTQWAVRPLRRLIPPMGKLDVATLVFLLLLQTLELALKLGVLGKSFNLLGLPIWAIGELLSLIITVFLVSIFVEVILSWLNPHSYNPFTDIIMRLNAPLLAPARRMLPATSGIDFSPLVVLVLLQLANMLIVAPIIDLGKGLSLG